MSDLTNLLLQDILTSPNKAETILESLTTDQILKIESTIHRVKRRKLDKDKNQVTAIAHCLAAIVSAAMQTKQEPKEESPLAEMKDGVEYVSFMYSHNRTLKQYSIKTDINHIHLETIHDKFKAENCVYPRANLPREDYKGNRWSYETECNDLGWKLAWLNQEIAGKRGLIQRAVDSYRNRYPSMRSRRVARQEKLMNGTLRKRKHREFVATPESLEEAIVRPSHQPKTIAIDDRHHTRYRIKIGIEQVSLDEISEEFRRQNCPFPRATQKVEFYMGGRQRWIQENMLNELAWKLAYLNPRILAGKKNLLQRALDVYRSKFMPSLQPRSKLTPNTPNFSLDEENVEEKPSISETDPMISPTYLFDESCNTSNSSSLACTPSPPVTADVFADVYDAFMLPPVNETFLLLDNDTNMGIRCDSFQEDNLF